MNWFYFSNFHSVLMNLYFYTITNSYSHSHHYFYDYFCYYCLCHWYCYHYIFIFDAFNFYFSSSYDSILFLYVLNISNKWRVKHCSKLAIKTLKLYQCLWGSFQHYLINLFVWRSSFEVTLLNFAPDNYFFYSVRIF